MLQDTKAKSLKSADKWLKSTDKLQGFLLRASKEKHLHRLIEQASGVNFSAFSIVRSQGQTLILQSSNAAVATQLRLSESNIIDEVYRSQDWAGSFAEVKVQVRPSYQKSYRQREPLRRISENNSKLLADTAKHSQDPRLKSILERLAKHRR